MSKGKELVDRWVKALRSGDYKQSRLTMYNADENGYCCLGVLCAIRWPTESPESIVDNRLYGNPETSALPADLAYEINISTAQMDELADMNDEGNSFEDIANFIEANFVSKEWRNEERS